jgi:hypothetical protein
MMRNFFVLLLTLTLFSTLGFAKHIDENTAKKVAENFLKTRTNSELFKNDLYLSLAYRSQSENSNSENGLTFYYVFNVNEQGFVIISADDNVIPVLAYSDQSVFETENMSPSVKKWLEEYKIQIRDVIELQIEATAEIEAEWRTYLKPSAASAPKSLSAVNPLLTTRWNQSPHYNALCPGGSVTGCVATAMAQVMKYWNYPANGSGFHSYNHSTYGTLSANFGSTTYNWGSMPNNVTSSNTAVATLMYHLGVSVNMNYSPQSSGAYVISAQSPIQNCSEYALKTYFGYRSTLSGVQRINYTQTQWINLLKNELDAGRPILYAGFGSGGGHAFVCDGYDNNNYFHFNWGWGGFYDGYFSINALNPSGTGTGGGTGGYNSGHQAVIGVQPPSSSQPSNISLNNFVTPSTTTLAYGNTFSITTNLVNYGSSTFNGDYCAAVFDNQYNFIDYVEIKTGLSLQSGFTYSNNLVFQNSGLFGMVPGTYYIGIFYKPSGGNWVIASNNGSYTNLVQMTVVNNNSIRLNSVMTVSPGTTLTQGQTASVNLNILNAGSTTFTGQYRVGLYNLDGSFVQYLGTVTESNGLPPNYTYSSPFLTFSNTVTASPGTYLLAVQHKDNSSSSWQLTGSTASFINPIKVIVKAATLIADIYENNNTVSQAYNLSLNFSNNSASRNTAGSNLHVSTDNDFYKIALAPGYDYSISARIHDSYNSGNGNTYTVDALFSYSTDGTNWSDTYDDVMNGNITVLNGGTVYFHLAPYFPGEIGTYLFDMTVNRTWRNVNIEETETADLIQVYPNPANEFVIIDLNKFTDKISQVNLLDINGKLCSFMILQDDDKIVRISTADLTEGFYILQMDGPKGRISKKIVVKK